MGNFRWFLGIRVLRDHEQKKLWLCQGEVHLGLAAIFGVGVKFNPQLLNMLYLYTTIFCPQPYV
jgi:hypothetical protein